MQNMYTSKKPSLMGMLQTTGHTTTSNTTKSPTPEGTEMSQETDPRPIHQLSCTLTGTINNAITLLLMENHTAKRRTRTNRCDRQCVKNKTCPTPFVFMVFFVCFFYGFRGERGVPKLPKLIYLPAPQLYDD
jgi:hypothetical protein